MNGRDLGTRIRPVWALAIASATGVAAALFLILGASPLAVVSAVVAGALGLMVTVTRTVRPFAFTVAAIATVGLFDYFQANDLLPLLGASMVALVIFVLLTEPPGRPRPRQADLGFALVLLAAAIPALVSSDIQALLGTGSTLVGVYLIGRVTAMEHRFVVALVLAIGASHAIATIGASAAGVGRLLPIPADQLTLVTARGIGFFLNPNTLGNIEAMALVLAVWWGVGPKMYPLVALVSAGLLLSGSREAVLATVAAVAAIGISHPRRALALLPLGGAALVAVLLVLPEILVRFDLTSLPTDPSVSGRLLSWSQAVLSFGQSPLIGRGLDLPFVIDQAYLGWLVQGGVIGASLWVAGVALMALASRAWPIVVVMLVAGLLANSFDGPTLFLLLLIVAAEAGRLDASPRMPERRGAAMPRVAPAVGDV